MDFGEQFAKLQTKNTGYSAMVLREPMHCKDGSTFSIQASEVHYCLPKNITGPYTHYEIGYPEDAKGEVLHEPLLEEYGDYPVYAYVPENVVIQILIKHGGLTNAN